MKRFFNGVMTTVVILGLQSQIFAYSDADLDGVEDDRDRCPASTMEELVDETGCVPKTGVTLALGGSRSSGDYGGSDTIISTTKDIQLAYARGGWYASAVTSYLESGVEEPVTGVESSSGMGDTYLGGGYTALLDGWSLGLQGVVKIPTADTDIGTGNSDVGAYATCATMNGSLSYFATLGYLVTGDDADTTYNDITSLNVGVGLSIGERLFASLSASRSDALTDSLDPAQSVLLFVGYRPDRCWFLNASYTKGLSDSVAEDALSLMVGYGF